MSRCINPRSGAGLERAKRWGRILTSAQELRTSAWRELLRVMRHLLSAFYSACGRVEMLSDSAAAHHRGVRVFVLGGPRPSSCVRRGRWTCCVGADARAL
jgi:hypothetical protein